MEINVRFPFQGSTCTCNVSFPFLESICTRTFVRCNVVEVWKLMYVFRFQDLHVRVLLCVLM